MSISQDLEDKMLLLRISEGNEYAFRQLFIKFAPLVQRRIARLIPSQALQEDMVQETFLKVWLHRDELPEITVFVAWVTRIAYNLALTHLRDEARHQRAIGKIRPLAGTSTEAQDYDTGHTVELRMLKEVIALAIAQLPPQQKKIYLLHREQGMLIKEISQLLHLSPQTIKNSLGLALKSIRTFIVSRGHHLVLLALVYSHRNYF